MSEELVQDLIPPKPVEPKPIYTGVKLTTLKVPLTGEEVKILGKHSPNLIVESILQILSKTGYVAILNVGQSGTGKTTWTRWLVHNLHQKKNFVIHEYNRAEIANMYNILDSLTSGVNHILVFEDASFYLNALKADQLDQLESKLTHIRHDIKAEVICIFNIHYSKAIKKFFRNVPFYFLTSLSMDEFENFKDMWRHAKWKLKDFVYYWRQMMFTDGWDMVVDQWNNVRLHFQTDKPLRLGLANENGFVHLFVYYQDYCNICDPESESKRVLNARQFIDNLFKSYTVKNARGMLKQYLFTRKGMKVLDSNRQSIWNAISEIDRHNKMNWEEVNDILDSSFKNKRKRTYVKKEILEANIKQIEEDSMIKELSEEQKEFESDVKDYLDHENTGQLVQDNGGLDAGYAVPDGVGVGEETDASENNQA
jgi:ABC-type oligopeptide transport system ATPase subunit